MLGDGTESKIELFERDCKYVGYFSVRKQMESDVKFITCDEELW